MRVDSTRRVFYLCYSKSNYAFQPFNAVSNVTLCLKQFNFLIFFNFLYRSQTQSYKVKVRVLKNKNPENNEQV